MRIEGFPLARLVRPGELNDSRLLAPRELPGLDSLPGEPPPAGDGGFAQMLEQALGPVNRALQSADREAQRVAIGEAESLHGALLAMAEADTALQITMRVTQKAIAAYQEIMRMPV